MPLIVAEVITPNLFGIEQTPLIPLSCPVMAFPVLELSVKEIAVHILDEGIQTVVVKKGSEGVFAITDSEECDVGTYECSVVDTTGAGDSFNSGFLYGKLNGYSLEESCKIGNWVASKAIEGFGMEKFPNLKDLKEFIN